MGKRKLRLAVIGAGHLGTIHTRLARSIDDVEFVGVVDPAAEVRERIANEFGVPTFADHRDIINKIDAAIIASPTEHHYWLGMELAEAGIHLFIEKPITTTSAEAEALIHAAAARKLVLQVGHVERFNPAFTSAANHIQRPVFIEAVRASGFTFRSTDVGVVMDLMIHDIDLVLSLVGSEVLDVEAIGAAVIGPHEDMAHARLQFANGCIANLNASRTSFEPQRSMQVFTEDAYVGIDFAASSAKIVHPSQTIRRREIDVQRLTPEQKDHYRQNFFSELLPLKEIQVEKRNAILDEQHDFVISIRAGQSPQVNGNNGRDALLVAERVLEAIAKQQSILRRATTIRPKQWDSGTTDDRHRKAG